MEYELSLGVSPKVNYVNVFFILHLVTLHTVRQYSCSTYILHERVPQGKKNSLTYQS